jgi:N-formylglutamate deformylase
MSWLSVIKGEAPLIVSIPHAGAEIPSHMESRLVSPFLARIDTDWHVDELYDFAIAMGATVISTTISRSVIDVNRDPSGVSLYPGQPTTGLCPDTTFDGKPLYREGKKLEEEEIEDRRGRYFMPYHAALVGEIHRLKRDHERVVVYDAHAIRSRVPRLFEGELPVFNIGTNSGKSCDQELSAAVQAIAAASGQPTVANARFKGGYITRSSGRPERGVHAIQMELAMRAYLREPAIVREDNWPPAFDLEIAAPTRTTLRRILNACIDFARDA